MPTVLSTFESMRSEKVLSGLWARLLQSCVCMCVGASAFVCRIMAVRDKRITLQVSRWKDTKNHAQNIDRPKQWRCHSDNFLVRIAE